MTYMIIALAVTVIVMLCARVRFSDRKLNENTFWIAATAILLFGLTLRLWLGYFAEGFETDLALFKSWAETTNNVGFSQIYSEDIYLDYPPGYLYVLVLLEKIRLALGIPVESEVFTLMIKTPAILGDIFCSWAILMIARKKLPDKAAIFAMSIYLFCPAAIINSARWGQIDSFCISFLLVSVLLLYSRKYIPSALLYGLSIILKPQMLVFVPLYIFKYIKDKKYIMLFFAPLSAIAVILLVALPFTNNFDYLWLVNRYIDTMNYYDFQTVNAYNIFALFGNNWGVIPPGIFGKLMHVIGPILATVLCGYIYFLSKRKYALFACPFILMSTTFMFTVKMHERYMFLALLFILIVYVLTREKRFLYAFCFVAITHYANVSYVLHLFNDLGGSYDPNENNVKLLALVQIISYIYLMYVTIGYYVFDKFREPKETLTADVEPSVKSKMVPADIISAAVVTLIYGIVAFWGLGAHETAVTPWLPQEGDTVVIKAEHAVSMITYIPGIADNGNAQYRVGKNVTVETSDDGKNWSMPEELPDTGVFSWAQHSLTKPAQYIRLTALDGSVVLNEIAIKADDYEKFEDVEIISGDGAALVDEQEVVPLYPTYYHSTYFDEIFHARTAYEHILEVSPYESTHPPLGKLIISVGIRIFGMNPFGWRVMGSLFGVLMLPALYYLLKQLFGKTFFCTIGTIIFAFDFMHFTQTRIATIDTYAVFFIILMFGQMAVFMKKDLLKSNMGEILIPLLLCGIFTGLGIASKWTAAYAAAGLAVLLFGKLIHTMAVTYRRDITLFKESIKKSLFICLWCLLFFLVIPFGIYFISFIPQTSLEPDGIWDSFFRYQYNMYSYHSDLEATHFFSSEWFEWPFMLKPMWYFETHNLSELWQVSTISALGNPAVWWVGIPAMIYSFIMAVKNKKFAGIIITAGFLSVYLPWVLVSRIAFIYHYFTAVPFLVCSIVMVLMKVSQRHSLQGELFSIKDGEISVKYYHVISVCYALVCVVLFAVYLPVISGFTVPDSYAAALELMETWYFT